MRDRVWGFLLVGLVMGMAGLQCSRGGSVGTAANPIRLYFMPLKGEAAFKQHAPVIEQFIEQATGLAVESILAPDYLTIVNAFNARSADIAFMNTLGYLMARDWTKVQAHLRLLYGEGEATYRGAIVARADRGIRTIKDLEGKTVVLPDAFSASGYLYALELLERNGVRPAKVVIGKGHVDALTMVYKGAADAAATYYEKPTASGEPKDARRELLAQYPDATSALQIVTMTQPIPNGPVALRSDLPVGVQTQLVGALLEFARTDQGLEALRALYNVTGLTLTKDSDYNEVQAVLKKLGRSSEEMIEGGLSFYKTRIGVGLVN